MMMMMMMRMMTMMMMMMIMIMITSCIKYLIYRIFNNHLRYNIIVLVWHSNLMKENQLRWHVLIRFIDNNL